MSQTNWSLDEARAEETTRKENESPVEQNEDVIWMDHVSFAYPGYEGQEAEPVLKDLSLRVRKGEFLALLGHNGSGKSTMARLLNAQLLPQRGTIRILGMDTADDANLWKIRAGCGMVFQNPDNQMVSAIVEEEVAFGPENLGVPLPELRERVDEALRLTGMEAFKRREPSKLSGGQKQRIAIAGVLAMLPTCIIMDEPTAMLDPMGRREIIETIHHLNREQGKTIVLITHNMEEVTGADRIVVLDEGRIAMEGTPREVFGQVDQLRALELDVPQVTEVGYRLHQMGFDVPPDALTVQELSKALKQTRQGGIQ